MKFWDTSAIVALLVQEKMTEKTKRFLQDDPDILVWWAAEVECVSALARLERAADTDLNQLHEAFQRLEILKKGWNEIEAGEAVRRISIRLLRVHDLRAADALQLGAAVVASENHPPSLEIVCLDDRLSRAAIKEGFQVLG